MALILPRGDAIKNNAFKQLMDFRNQYKLPINIKNQIVNLIGAFDNHIEKFTEKRNN